MTSAKLSEDPKWTRANSLFVKKVESADIALLGVPAHEGGEQKVFAAISDALSRYKWSRLTGS